MDNPVITRGDHALAFTTTPTDTMRFLCAGDGERPDITDERLAPGDGPPLHRHPWATWEVVIEGTFRVRADDEEYDAGPGDLIYTPAGAVHAFVVTGSEPGRLIGVNIPGGFHHMYAELAKAFEGDGPPDFGAMAAAAARHDAEILGPPLAVGGA